MKVTFCAICGGKITENANFCPFCGKKIDRSVEDYIEDPQDAVESANEVESIPVIESEPKSEEKQVVDEVQAVSESEKDTVIKKNEQSDSNADTSDITPEELLADTISCILCPSESEVIEIPEPDCNVEQEAVSSTDAQKAEEPITECPTTDPVAEESKKNKKSWIIAVSVIVIALGGSLLASAIRNSNSSNGKSVQKTYQDSKYQTGFRSFEYESIKTKYSEEWSVIRKETFDTGYEITFGDTKILPQKYVKLTVMQMEDGVTVEKYFADAVNNIRTDSDNWPCNFQETKRTTVNGRNVLERTGAVNADTSWNKYIKYLAFQDGVNVVLICMSNMYGDSGA